MVWAFNANGRETLPKEINNLVQTGNCYYYYYYYYYCVSDAPLSSLLFHV